MSCVFCWPLDTNSSILTPTIYMYFNYCRTLFQTSIEFWVSDLSICTKYAKFNGHFAYRLQRPRVDALQNVFVIFIILLYSIFHLLLLFKTKSGILKNSKRKDAIYIFINKNTCIILLSQLFLFYFLESISSLLNWQHVVFRMCYFTYKTMAEKSFMSLLWK